MPLDLSGVTNWLGGLFGGGADAAPIPVDLGSTAMADPTLGALPFSESGVPLSTATPASSSGLGDIASTLGKGVSGLGSIARTVAPVAGIGSAVMGGMAAMDAGSQSRAQTRALRHGQQIQERAATPLTEFGTRQLQRAEAGRLDPATQAEIEQWKQGARQKILDFFARAGLGDSQMVQEELRQIDLQGEAIKAQMIQQMEQTGVGALQGAASSGGGLAQTASQQGSQLAALIQQANQALGQMTGSGG